MAQIEEEVDDNHQEVEDTHVPDIDEEPDREGDEYKKFIQDLTEYHEKRGTFLDSNPKVGPKHINLLKLWNKVNAEGGYDRVSDTRGNKLAWRRISAEFLPSNSHIIQLAFQIKTVYYKYLAAYEISTIHKKEPPPKEILEDLTAKGGDLLNRTLENYSRRAVPEVEKLTNGADSDDSDNEGRGDRMDLDDTPNSGRVTRGLRHAPAQRILYGQDQLRTRSGIAHQSPTPGMNGIVYGSSAAATIIANYEPRPVAPSTVKMVSTPANNPTYFRDLAKRTRDNLFKNKGIDFGKGMMLPGTGFTGPNIYMRCLRSLESGMKDEVKYALHHLVKISFERGDKFLFSQFVNLADELIHIACNVSTIWYDHPGWQFTWKSSTDEDPSVLCELEGTKDLGDKIDNFEPVRVSSLQPDQFIFTLDSAKQATLVLRNMIQLEDNARTLSERPLVRDMMTIILKLPQRPETVELKYDALEIAETLTRFWTLDGNDSFYQSLLETVEQNTSDRGVMIAGLRALSRISMNLEAPNRLENVSPILLSQIYYWLLVEDDELRTACLDFLYQYTAIPDNVAHLVKSIDTYSLVDVLMNFLMLGAIRISLDTEPTTVQDEPATPADTAPSETLPKLAPSIIQKLCQIAEPKEQSSSWLRSCFVEDTKGEITQLALWSAYNEAFANSPTDHQLMVAKDFITNVTAVFPSAVARVVPHDNDRSKSKYTMKGISPRAVPTDVRGRALVRCQWRLPVTPSTEDMQSTNGTVSLHKDCDVWFSSSNPEEMWNHIVEQHLEIPKDPDNPRKFRDGLVAGSGRKFACLWTGCSRFPAPGTENAYKVAMHVKSHLTDADTNTTNKTRQIIGRKRSAEAAKLDRYYLNTPVDDKGNAVGVPLSSVYVLRNLARQMIKIDSNDMRGRANLIERHFASYSEKLYYVMTHNYSLRKALPDLIHYVNKGISMAHKAPRTSIGEAE